MQSLSVSTQNTEVKSDKNRAANTGNTDTSSSSLPEVNEVTDFIKGIPQIDLAQKFVDIRNFLC